MHLVGIGEILWDLIGSSEYLGGAVLNFSVQAARLGHRVSLVSAVGDDRRGALALSQARELGLDTQYIHTVPGHPTGIVTVTVDPGGQPSYVIHRPAAYDFASLDAGEFARLAAPPPDWIGYGTLHSMHPTARLLLDPRSAPSRGRAASTTSTCARIPTLRNWSARCSGRPTWSN